MSRPTSTPFRLSVGASAPVQQSAISCGAACLVVARMSLDPGYGPTAMTAGSDPSRWFAEQERRTMRRTNAFAVRGRAWWTDVGWPRFWGTSPWGARAELELGTGHRYGFTLLRGGDAGARARGVDRLLRGVTRDAPALLYVGDRWMPRHVTLLTRGSGAGDSSGDVLLYEPARGRVLRPEADRFVSHDLDLAGWDVPWFAVVASLLPGG